MQYLKLNNLLYHDFEICLDNIPNFLINQKSQHSLLSNLLNNIDINEETQIKVVKNNVSVEEVDSVICSISNITFVCEM